MHVLHECIKRCSRSTLNAQVETGVMSYMDLIMYAGYTRRTQILKECMVVDTEV